ncbi:hypothetical protein RLEG3_22920 [Rhizobium leguminosarum bv. trifolii WSM1689]|nr:hypothetical protein RLEG3_22920 [Rhizobium leguminosarum bv. trifolii WSM1689]
MPVAFEIIASRAQHVVGDNDRARIELGVEGLEAGEVEILPEIQQHGVDALGRLIA